MKTISRTICLLLSGFLAITLISCALSDSPAKGSSASVRIVFPDPAGARHDSRAIFGASGYLYARTIGGPPGDSGPAYGPYPVVGGVVVLSGFPAGTYSNIFILHTPKTLEGTTLTIGGESRTFEEAVALPDAEYLESVMNAGIDEGFNKLIDGYGSQAETGPITLNVGPNTVSLTLVPLCSTDSMVSLTRSGEAYTGSYGTATNRFIRLELANDPEDWSSVLFTIPRETVEPMLALWDSQGAAISDFAYDTGLGAYSLLTQAADFPLYLFLGSSSPESLSFSAADGSIDFVNPRLKSLTVNGMAVSPALADGVFDYAAIISSATEVALIDAVPVNPAHGITYDPSATINEIMQGQTRTTQITVTNPSFGSQLYNLAITREGVPDISVHLYATEWFSGSPLNVSYSPPSNSFSTSVLVRNDGSAPLTVSCSIASATANLFDIIPATAVIPVGNEVEMILSYTDTEMMTTRTATLAITSDDPDESPFMLTLSGWYC